jgi:hypothetical protein
VGALYEGVSYVKKVQSVTISVKREGQTVDIGLVDYA